MKLHEIALTEDQLDEARLRNALAAAGLAGVAAMSGLSNYIRTEKPHTPVHAVQPQSVQPQSVQPQSVQPQVHQTASALADKILDKYDIDPKLAFKIATASKRYAHPVFPTAKDILTIVGIESSFNPRSVSGLRRDPARGLMQVRPGVWNLTPRSLSTIDKQIRVGSTILHRYYEKLGSVSAAVHAYNVGLTNYRHQTNLNPDYVTKFKQERKMYDEI